MQGVLLILVERVLGRGRSILGGLEIDTKRRVISVANLRGLDEIGERVWWKWL